MTDTTPFIEINGRKIGPGFPVYVVAEISCNHNGSFDRAVELIRLAKEAGADAAKFQTYTADTITIDSEEQWFQIRHESLWEGRNLYDLYREAHTPWEWQPKLKKIAQETGIDFFCSPFDPTAVDFLEKEVGVPAYKVASFEIVDILLIQKIAATGKPMILSTGLANFREIAEAVQAARQAGCRQVALLKCTSNYPAKPSEMKISSIPHLARAFHCPVGLSDHTLGSEVALGAVALGACIVEKHLTLSRKEGGPDAGFSLEPGEFADLVQGVRTVEQAIGTPDYKLTLEEEKNLMFRRSLFVVANMKAGETFTPQNVRSIRPGHGLAPKHLPLVLGKKAARNIRRGTPLDWTLIVSSPVDDKNDEPIDRKRELDAV
ncbi:MAG: pseudaminic acid synthase [Candidatus Omnitrophica bacterium]|nr:pseudaminic acid synthase [Candidatus Omnitrophota bacterium]